MCYFCYDKTKTPSMKKKYFSITLLFCAVFLITHYVNAQTCTANFGYTTSGNIFNFSDSSVVTAGSISSWIWSFGDATAPSTQQNPTHTYLTCGTYSVSLTIVTSAFCTNMYTSTVTANSPMTISFTSTVDTTNGNTTYQAMPSGNNLIYTWDFGDTTSGNNVNIIHTYDTSGTYYVCLTVADTGGLCTSTICDSVVIIINPPIPTCNSTFTSNGNGGLTFFTAQPFNFNFNYVWDFGDGIGTGTGLIANYTYTAPGTFYVCLTTYDSATSCASTFCDSVVVSIDTICTPSYTYTNNNGTAVFTPTPFNLLNAYAWDYGDGGTGTILLGSHTYTANGTYYVCLTMTNQQSCTQTFCDSITITGVGIEELTNKNNYLTICPNPINKGTTVNYFINSPNEMELIILDLLGNRVSVIEKETKSKGKHTVYWSSEGLSKGIYYLQLKQNNQTVTKKIIVQ